MRAARTRKSGQAGRQHSVRFSADLRRRTMKQQSTGLCAQCTELQNSSKSSSTIHNPRQLEYACCWEKQRPATRFHHGTRKRALSCTFTAAKCMQLKISEKHTSEERGLESECCRTQLSALTEQRPAGSSQPCPDLTLAVTSYPGKCPCGHWGCVLPVSPPNPCAPAAPGWQGTRSCKLLHSEQALLSDHEKHHCVIDIILMLHPKHSTAPATKEKINCYQLLSL